METVRETDYEDAKDSLGIMVDGKRLKDIFDLPLDLGVRQAPLDTITPERRSEIMARIRGKDTKPEMAVRRLLHGLGYRYRLHRKDLPGKPDLVFGSRRKIIFVHGCFWHQHPASKCRSARVPKSRVEYWGPKLARNVERDATNEGLLKAAGWDVLVVWECEIKRLETLVPRLVEFLDDSAEERPLTQ